MAGDNPWIEKLSKGPLSSRIEAIDEAAERKDLEAIPALVTSLRSELANLRWRSARALGKIGDLHAGPHLIHALADSDEDVRRITVWALGEIRDTSSLSMLIDLAELDTRNVRESAIRALGKIGDRQALPVLTRALVDEDPNICRSAAVALGALKDLSAVAPLMSLFEKHDRELCENAAMAISEILHSCQSIAALEKAEHSMVENVRYIGSRGAAPGKSPIETRIHLANLLRIIAERKNLLAEVPDLCFPETLLSGPREVTSQ